MSSCLIKLHPVPSAFDALAKTITCDNGSKPQCLQPSLQHRIPLGDFEAHLTVYSLGRGSRDFSTSQERDCSECFSSHRGWQLSPMPCPALHRESSLSFPQLWVTYRTVDITDRTWGPLPNLYGVIVQSGDKENCKDSQSVSVGLRSNLVSLTTVDKPEPPR